MKIEVKFLVLVPVQVCGYFPRVICCRVRCSVCAIPIPDGVVLSLAALVPSFSPGAFGALQVDEQPRSHRTSHANEAKCRLLAIIYNQSAPLQAKARRRAFLLARGAATR